MARIQPVLTPAELDLKGAEPAAIEGKGHCLSPEELGPLAKRLTAASSLPETVRIKELLTRGFYGI